MFGGYFKKHTVDELEIKLPRHEIIRRSRILIIDDEKPDLIQDLKQVGYYVDFLEDIKPDNLNVFEGSRYDLVLLDFGNVGLSFGENQGLEILRLIKKIDSSIFVLTYTSKALGTKHAEFYRAADGTLAKDAGIGDSLSKIEDSLVHSHSIFNIWSGLLDELGVVAGSPEDFKLQDKYVRGLKTRAKIDKWEQEVVDLASSEQGKVVCKRLAAKLIELGVNWMLPA